MTCRKHQSKFSKLVNENDQIEVIKQKSKFFDFSLENKREDSFDYHEFNSNICELV